MDNTILPIEAIRERDVDLILLEELSAEVSFCEWFVRELDLPILTGLNGAWRSISEFGLGETDILFSYNSGDKKIIVLIENKLDTTFQDLQFERYKSRAREYEKNTACNQAFVILVAPTLYCENQNNFENYLTYEAILERFQFTGSKRNLFKAELLKITIEKLRRGYQPVNSEPVQRFWHSYWEFKEKTLPDLNMKKPGIVPHNSDWPMLFDDRLAGITFYHKLAQGNVDATFRGFSDEMEYKMKAHLPPGAKFQKHNKTFSIRIFSGEIDRTKTFDSQIKQVENGLRNIKVLRDWIIENNLNTPK